MFLLLKNINIHLVLFLFIESKAHTCPRFARYLDTRAESADMMTCNSFSHVMVVRFNEAAYVIATSLEHAKENCYSPY